MPILNEHEKNISGFLLKATTALNDTYFEGAEIFITEHNSKGAAGFVINKLFLRKLNELEEFNNASAIDIYEGGPVDNEHLYFIHSLPALGGTVVKDAIYFGGDIHTAAAQLSNGTISPAEIKIFIGYCGWNTGELEAEIEEGSWQIDAKLISSLFL